MIPGPLYGPEIPGPQGRSWSEEPDELLPYPDPESLMDIAKEKPAGVIFIYPWIADEGEHGKVAIFEPFGPGGGTVALIRFFPTDGSDILLPFGPWLEPETAIIDVMTWFRRQSYLAMMEKDFPS